MRHRFFVVLMGLAFVLGGHTEEKSAAAHDWQAGRDYALIDPPVPTSNPGTIEVVEVFSYACPHCAHFQPYADRLRAELPRNATLTYLPVVFHANWEVYARAFYTAQSFGVADAGHQALFDALHRDRRPLSTIEDLAAFYADYGVKPADFVSTAKSFVIDGRLAHGNELLHSYGIEYSPTLVVDGKYRITANDHVQLADMIEIAKFLVARENAAWGEQ